MPPSFQCQPMVESCCKQVILLYLYMITIDLFTWVYMPNNASLLLVLRFTWSLLTYSPAYTCQTTLLYYLFWDLHDHYWLIHLSIHAKQRVSITCFEISMITIDLFTWVYMPNNASLLLVLRHFYSTLNERLNYFIYRIKQILCKLPWIVLDSSQFTLFNINNFPLCIFVLHDHMSLVLSTCNH